MIDDDGAGSFDMIGSLETTMGTIMGAKQQTFNGNLMIPSDKKSRGLLIIRAEAIQNSNTAVKFQLACTELANITGGCLGMCGEISPVRYEIQRGSLQQQGSFVTV